MLLVNKVIIFHMKQTDKLVEAAQDLNETIKTINKKMDEIQGNITKIQEEMEQVLSKTETASKQWIDQQTAKLQKELDEITTAAQDWMQKQMDAAQKKLDDFKQKMAEGLANALRSAMGL